MIIIIDGYNLLKHVFPGSKNNLTKHKSIFIQQLAYYKSKKGQDIQEIIVVFDAGPMNHATRSIKSGITIVFSGVKSSADNWILHFVERNKNKGILIVTLDRNLQEECNKLGADWISVYDFYKIIQNFLLEEVSSQSLDQLPNGTSYKKYESMPLETETTHEKIVDQKAFALLMNEAILQQSEIKKDDIEEASPRKSKSYTLSKKEKRIQAKIKKLQ